MSKDSTHVPTLTSMANIISRTLWYSVVFIGLCVNLSQMEIYCLKPIILQMSQYTEREINFPYILSNIHHTDKMFRMEVLLFLF
jgi:hypothetical protein